MKLYSLSIVTLSRVSRDWYMHLYLRSRRKRSYERAASFLRELSNCKGEHTLVYRARYTETETRNIIYTIVTYFVQLGIVRKSIFLKRTYVPSVHEKSVMLFWDIGTENPLFSFFYGVDGLN